MCIHLCPCAIQTIWRVVENQHIPQAIQMLGTITIIPYCPPYLLQEAIQSANDPASCTPRGTQTERAYSNTPSEFGHKKFVGSPYKNRVSLGYRVQAGNRRQQPLHRKSTSLFLYYYVLIQMIHIVVYLVNFLLLLVQKLFKE